MVFFSSRILLRGSLPLFEYTMKKTSKFFATGEESSEEDERSEHEEEEEQKVPVFIPLIKCDLLFS